MEGDMAIRKSLLVTLLLIAFFRPSLALSQSQISAESQPGTGTLTGALPASVESCGERYLFERRLQSADAAERYSPDHEHGISPTCKEFLLDGPPQELLSRGTPSAAVKPSVPPINDLIRGSHPVTVSRPEELRDIGQEGTTIARVRQAVLEILESENKCSAWFRNSDPDVSATFRSLNFSVDEEGSNRVIKEQNDRGAWIEHGPYIASTGQNTGPGTTVTINANGAFFQRKDEIYKVDWLGSAARPTGTWRYLWVGPYDGGTLQAQVIAALHELAHAINAIPWDDSTRVGFYRSQENTELVLRYCRSEVAGSRKRLRPVMAQSSAN
jgi:hypothetical protein